MAMTIVPYKQYIFNEGTGDYVKLLESIGLIDVTMGSVINSGKRCSFKFPDGTQVRNAVINVYQCCAILYDLEAHIIVIIRDDYQAQRPAPDKELIYPMGMCVLPTSSGGVIELRSKLPSNYTEVKINDVFNIPAYPNYADTQNPDSCTLLPAYVGLPAGMFEIPNCYVALNATYIPGTKLIDETGTKWISLMGPLLYKVPTTD